MSTAQPHWISLTFQAAALLYAAALLATMIRPAWGRVPVALGVACHLGAMTGRGLAISFFPLTNKFESFSAAALALGLVAALTWQRSRLYGGALLALTLAALAASLTFPDLLAEPPPLMRTIWYPLHVPLSFLSYALWAAAAAAAVAWFVRPEAAWLRLVDRCALQGLGLWSASMICGGLWGVVAWGAYFLWDPKVIWSVILWLHYALFVHLRLTPALKGRAWVRPALALVGLVWVLVAYVGTSFFFGRSSHAF